MTIEVDQEALAEAWGGDDYANMTLTAPLVQAYLEAAAARKPVLRVLRYDDGETYRWTAVDSRNGLVVAASTQGYDDPRDRDHNIEMVLGGGYRLDLQ